MCGTCGGAKGKLSAEAGQADARMEELIKAFSRSGIQNLTINNYGSVSILGQDQCQHQKQTLDVRQSEKGGDVGIAWGWEEASIKVQNRTAGAFRKVRLEHRYDDNEKQQETTWENVGPGQTTSAWTTEFWQGPGHGNDYWKVHITLEDGGFEFTNDGFKQCNLRSDDVKGSGDLTFSFERDGTWDIDLRSGGCTTSYLNTNEGGTLDGFGWLQIENKMSRPISDIHVYHEHTGLDKRELTWSDKTLVGATTKTYPIYFQRRGISLDKWNIKLMRDGDQKPHENSNKNKWCSLNVNDQGQVRSIIVNDESWILGFSGNPCSSGWESMSVADATDEDSWTEASTL